MFFTLILALYPKNNSKQVFEIDTYICMSGDAFEEIEKMEIIKIPRQDLDMLHTMCYLTSSFIIIWI